MISDDHKSLPHFTCEGASYFVTSSTFNGEILPPDARKITLDCIRRNASKNCVLYATVVMHDHFHILLKPCKNENGEWTSLPKVMNVIKGYSSHKIKQLLNRNDPVWLKGYFEKVAQSGRQMTEFYKYITLNPIKAKLVEKSSDYPYLWNWEMDE